MSSLLTIGRRAPHHRLHSYTDPTTSSYVASCGKRYQRGSSRCLSFYRLFEIDLRGPKDKHHGRLHTHYFRDRNHSIYRYLSRHGWCLSTCGRSKIDNTSKDNKHDGDGAHEWYNLHEKRQQMMAQQYEDFKKQIDADPFGMLFGGRTLKRYNQPMSAGKSHDTDVTPSKKTSTAEGRQGSKASARDYKAGNDASRPISCSSKPQPSREEAEQVEEFVIDPITMRKVPKKHLALSAAGEENTLNDNFDIPVKKYTLEKTTASAPPQASNELPNQQDQTPKMEKHGPISSKGSLPWLVQEGFSSKNRQNEASRPSMTPKKQVKGLKGKPFKIESALDRYLMARRKMPERNEAHHSGLKYTSMENSMENVDLLRPSDVRASSGLRNRLPKETVKEKQERRAYLEDHFQTRVKNLDAQFKAETPFQKVEDKSVNAAFSFDSNQANLDRSHMNAISDIAPKVQNSETSSNVPRSQDTQKPYRHEDKGYSQDAVNAIHQEEIKTQKAAMEAIETRKMADTHSHDQLLRCSQEPGEGDMASNVHLFMSRDRWYKRKAPHATQTDQELQQRSKDKALIREIRSIYEDQYGIIDTSHRQPLKPATQSDEQQSQVPKQTGQAQLEPGPQEFKPNDTANFDNQPLSHPPTKAYSNVLDSHQNPIGSSDSKYQGCKVTHEFDAHKMIHRLSKVIPHIQHLLLDFSIQNSVKHTTEAKMVDGLKAYEESLSQTFKAACDVLRTSKRFSNGIDPQKDILPEPAKDDTEPRPSSKSPKRCSSSPPTTTLYKILAYESSTQKILTAKISSSTGPFYEKSLNVIEALSGLTNPARFLPHFTSLQDAGYEIISGSSNILIFKKLEGKSASEPFDEPSESPVEHHPTHTNPIDGTTTQTGNFASPTGFVNHDSILPPDLEEEQHQQQQQQQQQQPQQPSPSYPWTPRANDKIRREEPVFSGSRKGREEHRAESKSASSQHRNKQRRTARRRKTLKRMLWVGTFVAGCCYAVGVTSEALRS